MANAAKGREPRRSEQAVRLTYKAEHERGAGSAITSFRADAMEAESAELLKPPVDVVVSDVEAISTDSENYGLIETLRNPSMVSFDASEQRMELAAEADVLAMALDAGTTLGARNSLEKMLAAQMAAAHAAGMKLIARAGNEKIPIVETVRLTNGAARLMDSFQNALLTLQKLRTGGNQKILVQHVNVNQGGQAVIAGGDVGAKSDREVSK